MNLLKKARYFPLEKGQYEVAPGLKMLGTDFGNGVLDQNIIQIDESYLEYINSKTEAYRESLTKYIQTERLSEETERAVVDFLLARLEKEYASYFEIRRSGKEFMLTNKITGEKIDSTRLDLYYLNPLHALVRQIPEDIAILQNTNEGDYLAYLNLCSPSHWAAADKIGKPFTFVHAPIPHIEKINAAAKNFVDAMIHKGPYVRFVWGFGTDSRLNHHPEPPPGVDRDEWRGRAFDIDQEGEKFYLRLERQVTVGLPEVNAALFFIHVYSIPASELHTEERKKIVTAIQSMTPESLKYKGLDKTGEALVQWLQQDL